MHALLPTYLYPERHHIYYRFSYTKCILCNRTRGIYYENYNSSQTFTQTWNFKCCFFFFNFQRSPLPILHSLSNTDRHRYTRFSDYLLMGKKVVFLKIKFIWDLHYWKSRFVIVGRLAPALVSYVTTAVLSPHLLSVRSHWLKTGWLHD